MSEFRSDRCLTDVMLSMIAATALTVGFPVSADGATVSGVYVGASADNVQMVQIVRTPDGRLVGRIEDVTLAPNGSVQDNAMAMDGAADGQQITLSPKAGFIATFGGSVSGFVDGDLLDLSWQGGHSVLRRSDAYGFEAAVAALHTRSAQMAADRQARDAAQAKLVAAQSLRQLAQNLTDRLDALDRTTAKVTVALAQVDDQYAGLGRAAQHKRSQQRVLSELSGYGVASMSAGTDAQGIIVQMNGLRGTVNGMRGTAHTAVETIRQELSSIELGCRNDPIGSTAGDPCRDLAAEKARLDATVEPLQAAFDQAENAYADAVAQANERPHLFRRLFQQ